MAHVRGCRGCGRECGRALHRRDGRSCRGLSRRPPLTKRLRGASPAGRASRSRRPAAPARGGHVAVLGEAAAAGTGRSSAPASATAGSENARAPPSSPAARRTDPRLLDDAGAEVDQDLGNVDLDRAHLVAGAAQRRGVGQRLRVLQILQLRRQDRADRTAVDRPVRVAAGLPVDRAGVQARGAADAVQRLARAARRPALSCGRCRAARRGTPPDRRPRVMPVQIVLYGFIRSPVAERGSSWRKTSRSCSVGTIFSIPASVISIRGSVRHIRALPSDSTTQTPPVSATRKLAPLKPTGTRRNFSRRNCRAADGQVLRLAAERRRAACGAGRCRGSRRGCGAAPAPRCATADRRRAG